MVGSYFSSAKPKFLFSSRKKFGFFIEAKTPLKISVNLYSSHLLMLDAYVGSLLT